MSRLHALRPTRRWLFIGVIVGVWVLVIEMGAYVSIRMLGGVSAPNPHEAPKATDTTPRRTGLLPSSGSLHPYLGYTLNPNVPDLFRYPLSTHGFSDDQPPLHRRNDEQLIVGIFGGSLARHFGMRGAATLEHGLRASPQRTRRLYS